MWKKNLRNIKLVTKERRRNYLVSEPNYHATKFSTEYSIAIEVRATQILMNKSVCWDLLIAGLSKNFGMIMSSQNIVKIQTL